MQYQKTKLMLLSANSKVPTMCLLSSCIYPKLVKIMVGIHFRGRLNLIH